MWELTSPKGVPPLVGCPGKGGGIAGRRKEEEEASPETTHNSLRKVLSNGLSVDFQREHIHEKFWVPSPPPNPPSNFESWRLGLLNSLQGPWEGLKKH